MFMSSSNLDIIASDIIELSPGSRELEQDQNRDNGKSDHVRGGVAHGQVCPSLP